MGVTAAEAKQFLVDRIAAEATREGAPLEEFEKEMLGFGEAEAGMKALERARASEPEFNAEAYESRIARLAKAVYDRDVEAGRKAEWDAALDELAAEDLYLFVMLEHAGLVKTTSHFVMPEWRMLVGFIPPLICVALAIVVAVTPLGGWLIPSLAVRIAVAVVLLLAPFALSRMRGRRAS